MPIYFTEPWNLEAVAILSPRNKFHDLKALRFAKFNTINEELEKF